VTGCACICGPIADVVLSWPSAKAGLDLDQVGVFINAVIAMVEPVVRRGSAEGGHSTDRDQNANLRG
jgi:hypothetical protein